MKVEAIRQSLTNAIWFIELAYNEEDDIPHLRSLLDEAVYLIQEVLLKWGDPETISLLMAKPSSSEA